MLGVGDVGGLSAVVPGLRVGGGLLARGLAARPRAVRVAQDLVEPHQLVAVVARVHRAVVEVPEPSNEKAQLERVRLEVIGRGQWLAFTLTATSPRSV